MWIALLAVLFVIGCGGGGGGGGSSSTGGNSNLQVFLTDNLNTGYSNVWGTLYRVELLRTGSPVVVYNETAGQPIDFRRLSDGTNPLYKLLATANVPAGAYTGVRIIVDADVVLYPTGNTTGQARTFAGSVSDRKELTFNFAGGTRNLGAGTSQLVIDFDLENWTDDGVNVNATAFIKEGSTSGIDDINRQVEDEYKGTISGLTGTAPIQTFTLTTSAGAITVAVDANTSVYRDSGTASPSLTNGIVVEVNGVFSTAQNRLLAASVKIDDDDNDDPQDVKGVITSINTGGLGSVAINVTRARGFVPTSNPVTVQFAENTRFFSDNGVSMTRALFIAALQTGKEIEAEGTLSGGNLIATKAKLEDEDDDNAEIRGQASNINQGTTSFTVTLSLWQGLAGSAGQPVNVTTSMSTVFRDQNNGLLTQGQFYSAITAGAFVEVEGSWDGTTLTATEVKIEDGADNEGKVIGPAQNINTTAFTFTTTAVSWEFLPLVNGQVVNISTSNTTEFRNANGDEVSRAVFFDSFTPGSLVEVEGTLTGGTLNATKVRVQSNG